MRLHAQPGPKDAGLSAAEAYTRIAAGYDDSVAGDAWMRRALHAHCARVFRPGEQVLDIGCGTGLDAVFLAQHGVRVLGVDASPGMLEQARTHVTSAGVEPLVELRLCDASDLDALKLQSELDGAISAFAALNTVPDLDAFAKSLRNMIRPRGRGIVHMLNRFSLWEFLGACMHHDWRAARMTGRASTRPFTIGGQPVPHRMYTWRTACAHFQAHDFSLRGVYGLGALRPPHTVRRIPSGAVRVLERLDVRLGGLPRLRDAGRFFVLDLERCATQN